MTQVSFQWSAEHLLQWGLPVLLAARSADTQAFEAQRDASFRVPPLLFPPKGRSHPIPPRPAGAPYLPPGNRGTQGSPLLQPCSPEPSEQLCPERRSPGRPARCGFLTPQTPRPAAAAGRGVREGIRPLGPVVPRCPVRVAERWGRFENWLSEKGKQDVSRYIYRAGSCPCPPPAPLPALENEAAISIGFQGRPFYLAARRLN